MKGPVTSTWTFLMQAEKQGWDAAVRRGRQGSEEMRPNNSPAADGAQLNTDRLAQPSAAPER